LELNKPFLSVHLEDTNINAIHRGLKLSIGALQFIPKHMFDEDVYVRKLSEAVGKPLPIDVSQSYGDKKSDCAKLGLEKKAEDGSYEFRSDPGWLQAHSHRWPKAGQGWSNSLNLRFVPAGTDNILLSTYLVRVQDFTEFIECTQHPMTGGIFVVRAGLIWDYDQERNWKNPGYEQEPDHPVVGVSWNDAMAFCKWLTLKEKNAGLMGPHQYYRLPKDTEWSAAVGPAKYPWGDNWPPAEGTGKFAEQSFAESIGISNGPFFPWRDKYPRTSPVGTYRPNDYGLYDMAGNVMEWCDDWYTSSLNSSEILTKLPHLKLGEDGGGKKYKCIRSSSWNAFESEGMLSNLRYPELPSFRDDNNGFRLALSLSES
jgi:formylglycine-generating enzyme required for sulfatase activity